MGDLWSDEGFGGGGFGGEGFGDEDDWDEGEESLETDVEDALGDPDVDHEPSPPEDGAGAEGSG